MTDAGTPRPGLKMSMSASGGHSVDQAQASSRLTSPVATPPAAPPKGTSMSAQLIVLISAWAERTSASRCGSAINGPRPGPRALS